MFSEEGFPAADDERNIGEWIYKTIAEEIVREDSGWAFEKTQRVAQRLNQVRERRETIKPVVIWIRYLPGGRLIALFLGSAKWMFPNPDRERQADEYGLDLCLAAGYEGRRCLELFDV